MYKAIKYFVDLQDNEHPYNAGDTFPRDGLEVSKERIIELSTAINRRKEPLITFVEDDDVKEENDTDDSDTDVIQNDDKTPKEDEQVKDGPEKPKKPGTKKK